MTRILHRLSARSAIRAFTLIELLVVISIIALLIGILLPALGRARVSANTLACATQEQQLGRAMALYNIDEDGHYPISARNNTWDDKFGAAGYDGRSQVSLAAAAPVDPVEGDVPLYVCPLDDFAPDFGPGRRTYSLNALQIDSDGSVNGQLRGVAGQRLPSGGFNNPVSIRVDDVVATSDFIVMAENLRLQTPSASRNLLSRTIGSEIQQWNHRSTRTQTAGILAHHAVERDASPLSGVAGVEYRPNYLFADGHVVNLDPDVTYENARSLMTGRGSSWDYTAGR